DDPARGGQIVITLPQYVPVIGNTPSDFLIFCGVVNGKFDVSYGVPASAAVVDYLKAAVQLDDRDPVPKLGFLFAQLEARDPTIAADAFFEFARASDTEILKAREKFDAAVMRRLIASPTTPEERLGVFAFVLGVCGGSDDAAFLAAMLTPNPLPAR